MEITRAFDTPESVTLGPKAEGVTLGSANIAAPLDLTPHYHEAIIKKVANGFIVKVGCQTFVSKAWDEVAKGLEEYWINPSAAQQKFCRTPDLDVTLDPPSAIVQASTEGN